MQTKSLWVETAAQPEFSALKGNLEVDVAIVGGGITGLTAGILLQRAGKRVAIIDNLLVATGESGYTTAHLTQVLDVRYHKLISDFGEDKARLAAISSAAAISQIEKLIQDYRIACDFTRLPGYLYSENGFDSPDLSNEIEALQTVLVSAELIDEAPLPFKTTRAIRVDGQAQFHPRQYMLSIAEQFLYLGGKVFERTRAIDVADGTPCLVKTETGTITASDVIISANVSVTNWLFLNTKIAAYRSYALSAKLHTPIPPGLYWDTLDPYHYVRSYHSETDGDFLLAGGEDHKTGANAHTETCFKNLEQYTRQHFDIEDISYFWSGQIIKPLDGLPYIGLNSLSKHVYVSTGYSGNGMTFGTLGGMILSDLVLGKSNPWASLYEATRLHPIASIGNFLSENIGIPAHFIGDRLSAGGPRFTSEIGKNEGKIITVDGKQVAAYRGDHGELHAFSAVCPHMGCIIHWNGAESSWDCPCHGSRFDSRGKVVNGPALTDLKPIQILESKPTISVQD